MARVANLCDTVTQRLLLTDPGLQGRGPRPQVPVPTYTGYDDRKSVADFLAELAAYKLAAGASDEYVLARVLPVALQASAARWWRIVAPFLSWEDFRRRFQDEFLPPGYQSRVQRELERRTQHPDETLVEYVRVMQELFDRACPTTPESDRVARVVQQSHPRFRPYLHGRTYETLEHLARDARGIQETLLAELQYRPPPPPEEALEPSCAWSAPGPRGGPTQRQPQEYGAVLPPRALDPYAFGQRERGRAPPGGLDPRPSAWPAGSRLRQGESRLRSFPRDSLRGADRWPNEGSNRTQRQAPSSQTRDTDRRISVRCFGCGRQGHFRRDCPDLVGNRPAVSENQHGRRR
ncbi:uncharacterized protein LOC120842656 [Ixodes scapularis]|uniref:uncharacterized protein LOC120842656 n=1 Tax=Ixodes scapularis TaxID=6945 RepID=UPI001A9CDE6F|nr:uncharacterized protein LOC120842656 [Ixodes scapularis]